MNPLVPFKRFVARSVGFDGVWHQYEPVVARSPQYFRFLMITGSTGWLA